jgi:hypothetical protein
LEHREDEQIEREEEARGRGSALLRVRVQ